MGEIQHQLTLRLFGAPEVRAAGLPLVLHHQKARALLYYLAVSGRPSSRDHLASLLWSESLEGNARHSLRSSLYHLRQALHAQNLDAVLLGDSEQIALELDELTCDVVVFRRLLADGSESALHAACKLYQGSFLQGFTVTDAPVFEEWQRFEADTLTQMYLSALRRLAAWAQERQEWQQALLYLQQILQFEPLAEEIQQRLITLYLQTGAIGQALRQYYDFEAELRHELGIAPTSETQALLQSMLMAEHTTAVQPASSRFAQRQVEDLPLVGRDALLSRFLKLSAEVCAGRGSTVLVQGEDGSGRSRLLSELIAALYASESRWIILQGSCSPFDDLLSYGPFLEAFQHADLGDLSNLLAEDRATDAVRQKHFLWSVLQALQALARGTAVLLAIDDLQWANSPTLHLFGFLATRLRHLPIFLVGTVQRVEAIPALQRLITLRRRHGDVHLLSLLPLTSEDVGELTAQLGIDTEADAWAATAFSTWLYERSGGSPFILGEIIAQLQADQILSPRGDGLGLDTGRWRRWRATFTLPETARDLVTWRLTNLSAQARKVLEVLAVANLPLPFDLISNFPGVQQGELLLTLEELETRGLVLEDEPELFVLSHHLVYETLLSPLSRLRRQDIHRQLASIMEQCPALREHFPARQVALHAVAGADPERARRYGLLVLDELVRDNANPQTATFLQHLYDLLAPTATPHELLRLTTALGHVYRSLGQLESAMGWYLQQLAQAEKLADPAARAAAHFEIGELALVANDFQTAAEAARAGLAQELPATCASRLVLAARGHRLLGAALAMEGSDLSSAERHLQESVAAHRQIDATGELCATLFELGNVAAQRGEIGQALELYQEAADTAELANYHYLFALAQNNLAYHNLVAGRLLQARQALEVGQKVAERYELFGALMHLASTRGELHLYLGEWQGAAAAFHDSLALAEELANLERQAGNRAGLGLAERGQGHLAAALSAFTEVLTLLTEHASWHLTTRLQLWLAETHLLRGETREAQGYLDTALATAQTQQRALLLLQAERLYAHLCFMQGNVAAAEGLCAQAIERAERLHLPLEIARTKLVWGQELLQSAGHPRTGQKLLEEARQLFEVHHALAELRAFGRETRA